MALCLLTTSKKMETLALKAQKLISASNLNDQETDSPIESKNGTQPGQHLDFSAMRTVSDF